MIHYDAMWPTDSNYKSHKFVDSGVFTQFCPECQTAVWARAGNCKVYWVYDVVSLRTIINNEQHILTCREIKNIKQMNEALV